MNNRQPVAKCRVCENTDLVLAKPSDLQGDLNSTDFEITDKNYGHTLAIYRCSRCDFLQCSDLDDVLQFYEDMDDEDYEDTRDQRALQARALIGSIRKHRGSGTLLDVGAGSGILVEQAIASGFDACGIEPSVGLHRRAIQRNLPVVNGVLPSAEITGVYDIVTLIDIIEHVAEPYDLLQQAEKVMARDGILVVVTPDVRSLAARIMGWRWWHFRIAHIGYFNRNNLERLLDRANLVVVQATRPSWYFPADYLFDRVMSYLPEKLRIRAPRFLKRINVPLNLLDSMMLVCRRKDQRQ